MKNKGVTNGVIFLSILWGIGDARAKADASTDALTLCRVLVAEAGRSPKADHAAILYVLSRRAALPAFEGKSLAEVATAYSTAFNGRSVNPERAARMRALRLSDIPRHIVALVVRWLAGVRPQDPCPGAWHFAARSLPSPLPRVQCNGETVNHFYMRASAR